jgi:hypothetical protein
MESRSADLLCRLAKGLQVDLDALFSLEGGAPPAQLSRKMERLMAEVTGDDLPRVVRMLEALMHGMWWG